MADVARGIFTLVDPNPDELDTFDFALSAIRFDVRELLPVLMRPHRIHYTDDIPGSAAVPRPEGRYPGGRLIQVRPMRSNGIIRRNRVAGTTIHEFGHGFMLSRGQREAFIDLFNRTGTWRGGPYWESVNEAFCYWLTRIATDGRLVSPYEARTLDLPDGRHDDFLTVLREQPVDEPEEPEPVEPEPGPDPELLAMRERAEVAERERDQLLEWQREVRRSVDASHSEAPSG